MKNLKEKIADKLLLAAELPLYPFVYYFLKSRLQTKEGRASLYLRTKGYVPVRRLLFYTLDKLFLEVTQGYSKPSYSGIAGYILDLKYAIAHSSFNKMIFKSNYSQTLSHIKKLIQENGERKVSVIDFGCGAGVLTRAIASAFPNAHVTGLDIREETMAHNAKLYPHITWGDITTLSEQLATKDDNQIILICNGVINFMNEAEVDDLLSKKVESIVWFYFAPFTDPLKEYERSESILAYENNDVHYNVPLFLKKHGYSFLPTLTPTANQAGYFMHVVSRRS